MPNQAVSVPAGATPTLLNGGLTAGSVIYNGDSKNTVWIASNPAVSPGNGIPLTALGSLTWSGGAVYAIADTGVTTGTALNISGDVSSVDNPVAIGTAVATQLLAQGVPSVLLGKMITNLTNVSTASGYWTVPVNVNQYASLIIRITTVKDQSLQLGWVDSGSGITIASKLYVMATAAVRTPQLTIETPVKADTLTIFFTDKTSTFNVTVYASNRALPEGLTGQPPFYASSIPSTAYAGYQVVAFPDVFYTRGGVHTVHLTPNGGGVKGYFGVYLVDAYGNSVNPTLFDSSVGLAGAATELEITQTINLPPGNYRFWWQNGPTAQTYPTILSVYLP